MGRDTDRRGHYTKGFIASGLVLTLLFSSLVLSAGYGSEASEDRAGPVTPDGYPAARGRVSHGEDGRIIHSSFVETGTEGSGYVYELRFIIYDPHAATYDTMTRTVVSERLDHLLVLPDLSAYFLYPWNHVLTKYSMEDGSPLGSLHADMSNPVITSDGGHLICSSSFAPYVRIIGTAALDEVPITNASSFGSFEVSPDGRYLLYRTGDPFPTAWVLFDLETRTETARIVTSVLLGFAADSSRIAGISSSSAGTSVIEVYDLAGNALAAMPVAAAAMETIWILYFTDSTITIYRADSSLIESFDYAGGPVGTPVPLPDRNYGETRADAGNVLAMSAREAPFIVFIDMSDASVLDIAWTPVPGTAPGFVDHEITINAVVGTEMTYAVQLTDGYDSISVSGSGLVPEGGFLVWEGGNLSLRGTPEGMGTYTVMIAAQWTVNGNVQTDEQTITVTVSSGGGNGGNTMEFENWLYFGGMIIALIVGIALLNEIRKMKVPSNSKAETKNSAHFQKTILGILVVLAFGLAIVVLVAFGTGTLAWPWANVEVIVENTGAMIASMIA